MKIYDYIVTKPIIVVPTKRPPGGDGDRWYLTTADAEVVLHTDCGTLTLSTTRGFVTDGRSGPGIVDWVIPKLGTQRERACWYVHDIWYYFDNLISFGTATSIFKQMRLQCGGSGVITWLAVKGIEALGANNYGVNTPWEKENKNHITIVWSDK